MENGLDVKYFTYLRSLSERSYNLAVSSGLSEEDCVRCSLASFIGGVMQKLQCICPVSKSASEQLDKGDLLNDDCVFAAKKNWYYKKGKYKLLNVVNNALLTTPYAGGQCTVEDKLRELGKVQSTANLLELATELSQKLTPVIEKPKTVVPEIKVKERAESYARCATALASQVLSNEMTAAEAIASLSIVIQCRTISVKQYLADAMTQLPKVNSAKMVVNNLVTKYWGNVMEDVEHLCSVSVLITEHLSKRAK